VRTRKHPCRHNAQYRPDRRLASHCTSHAGQDRGAKLPFAGLDQVSLPRRSRATTGWAKQRRYREACRRGHGVPRCGTAVRPI